MKKYVFLEGLEALYNLNDHYGIYWGRNVKYFIYDQDKEYPFILNLLGEVIPCHNNNLEHWIGKYFKYV